MTARKKYSLALKLRAANLVLNEGCTQVEVARRYNIPERTLNRWVKKYQKKTDDTAPRVSGKLTPEQAAERRRLLREIRQLKTECEILRKAQMNVDKLFICYF